MADDDDRQSILARRRAFIALALAGGTTAAAAGAAYRIFAPCLSVEARAPDAPDSGPADGGRPMMPMGTEGADAGFDAGAPEAGEDADALDAGEADAGASEVDAGRRRRRVRTPPVTGPMPCLSFVGGRRKDD